MVMLQFGFSRDTAAMGGKRTKDARGSAAAKAAPKGLEEAVEAACTEEDREEAVEAACTEEWAQ